MGAKNLQSAMGAKHLKSAMGARDLKVRYGCAFRYGPMGAPSHGQILLKNYEAEFKELRI
jgi:hypothetical protein